MLSFFYIYYYLFLKYFLTVFFKKHKRLVVVAHTCNHIYFGGRVRRTALAKVCKTICQKQAKFGDTHM
jgi:hypothetical protein